MNSSKNTLEVESFGLCDVRMSEVKDKKAQQQLSGQGLSKKSSLMERVGVKKQSRTHFGHTEVDVPVT